MNVHRLSKTIPNRPSTVDPGIPIRRLVRTLAVGLALAAVLGACNLGKKACPSMFSSLCGYIEDMAPLIESADAIGLQQDVYWDCCKGDYASPEERRLPGYDPFAFCVRSGTFRGEGACLTEEEFSEFLLSFAPLSVEHLIYTEEHLPRLKGRMRDTAVLVKTVDPDWYLLFVPDSDFSGWYFSTILKIGRGELEKLPESAFVSWPLDARTPNPIPHSTQGTG